MACSPLSADCISFFIAKPANFKPLWLSIWVFELGALAGLALQEVRLAVTVIKRNNSTVFISRFYAFGLAPNLPLGRTGRFRRTLNPIAPA